MALAIRLVEVLVRLAAVYDRVVVDQQHVAHLQIQVQPEALGLCQFVEQVEEFDIRRLQPGHLGEALRRLHQQAVVADAQPAVVPHRERDLARAHGVDHIVHYRRENLAERVRELTDGTGVPVVYDSVGKDTFAASLASLKRRGLLVCFGTASGPVPPIDAMQLALAGSVFVTRPALADYIADPADRDALSAELFGHVAAGRIAIEINQRYALKDAAQAHHDLESGRTTGSSVFVL